MTAAEAIPAVVVGIAAVDRCRLLGLRYNRHECCRKYGRNWIGLTKRDRCIGRCIDSNGCHCILWMNKSAIDRLYDLRIIPVTSFGIAGCRGFPMFWHIHTVVVVVVV